MTHQPPVANSNATQFRLQRPATALGLLGCMFLFCLVISGVLLPFIPKIISRPEAAIKITVVIQDLLVFIVPAVATAMIVTRLPARLLCVDKWPSLAATLLSCAVLLCSIPAMNAIIEWNKSWHLSESFQSLEQFFVAFIFSAFHFQLFGLVPRMLLGAFFGYLLWWSKSLWLPITLHVLNNSIVVIATYLDTESTNTSDANRLNHIGTDFSSTADMLIVIASVAITTAGIILLHRYFHNKKHQ